VRRAAFAAVRRLAPYIGPCEKRCVRTDQLVGTFGPPRPDTGRPEGGQDEVANLDDCGRGRTPPSLARNERDPFPATGVWHSAIEHPEWRTPVSDTLLIETKHLEPAGQEPPRPFDVATEDDRPPVCPRCHKRLVILSSQWTRSASGASIRRQLWGCPRGHAAVYRTNGLFGQVETLPDAVG
jgi:hypothetical protein